MTDEELEGIVKAKVVVDRDLSRIRNQFFMFMSEETQMKNEVERLKLEKKFISLTKKIQDCIDGE